MKSAKRSNLSILFLLLPAQDAAENVVLTKAYVIRLQKNLGPKVTTKL